MTIFAHLASIRTKLLVAFVIPLTAWLAVSISQATALYFSEQAGNAISHSRAILATVHSLERQILDAETGLRGYIISGQQEFLAPYRAAVASFPATYHALFSRLQRRPDELAEARRARTIYDSWQKHVAGPLIAARRATPPAAVAAATAILEKLVDFELAMRAPASKPSRQLEDIRTDLHQIVAAAPGDRSTNLAKRAIHDIDDLLEARGSRQKDRKHAELLATLDQLTDALISAQHTLGATVANGGGKTSVDAFRGALHKLASLESTELKRRVDNDANLLRLGQALSWIGPLFGLVLAVLLALRLSGRARDNLNRINDAAGLLANGDLTARVVPETRDEIGELAHRFNAMAELVQQRSREAVQLTDMSEMLQGCIDTAEAFRVFSRLAGALFPSVAGGLYLISPSRDDAVLMATWGDQAQLGGGNFAPEDCWALRLGKPHDADTSEKVHCAHFADRSRDTLCIPLHAYGETLGLLSMAAPADQPGYFQSSAHRIAFKLAVAEHLSLALANLRLRESLRNQSVRDPLTGLFNRRYLEETLHRELSRADRHKQPLSVIAFDVDHFKRYNDTYGHEGGDAVLTAMGNLLLHEFRTDDVACRSGGEEFIVVLPNATLEQAGQRAEGLRRTVAQMQIKRDHIVLDPVTISLGVAIYPAHARSARELLRAADRALYKAKEDGRDRVVTADGRTLAS